MAKAVATVTDTPAPAVANEGATILGMIDRIMAMPDIPVERIEQMFALHQKVQADAARKAYAAAFAQMQPELPTTLRHGAIKHGEKIQSRYAKWEDVSEDIMPVLAKHGFGLSFRTKNEPGKITVTGVLSHREGHSEETMLELPADTSGSKNAVQAVGSSVQYGKRYTASALLNLVSRDEDDDGQSAAGPALISDAQADELLRLIRDTKTNPEQFKHLAKVENISDIKAANFDILKGLLETKKRNLQKAEAPV
jgi:hypothetical protein